MKKLLTALAAAAALTSATAQAADSISVAATAVPHAEILEFIKPALAKDGVEAAKSRTEYGTAVTSARDKTSKTRKSSSRNSNRSSPR